MQAGWEAKVFRGSSELAAVKGVAGWQADALVASVLNSMTPTHNVGPGAAPVRSIRNEPLQFWLSGYFKGY